MPQRLRTGLWVVVLLLCACATEFKGKQLPRSEPAAGARAADSSKAARGRRLFPGCVNGEISVPHSANDPCPQDDPICRAAGGTAFASCEGGKWPSACSCFVPQAPPNAQTICGDSLIQKPEQCDQMELNQATCVSLGFQGGGVLRCHATTCEYDTRSCRS